MIRNYKNETRVSLRYTEEKMSVVFNNEGERIISDALVRETEGQMFLASVAKALDDVKSRDGIDWLGELMTERGSVAEILKKVGAGSDFEQIKKTLLSNEHLTESLRKLGTAVPTDFIEQQNYVRSFIEKIKTFIPDMSPVEAMVATISPEDLKVRTDEIRRKKEELSDFDIIATARRQGLSDAALSVYDIIKSPPTLASNFCIIKDFQYLDRFHYHAFKYGLKELQLMGYIYSFHEGKCSYVLYFTPHGIDAFSNRSLLNSKVSYNPILENGGYDRTQLDSAVLYLMRECSGFEHSLPFLIKRGYVEIRDNFLYWKESKQSLAQYFGDILSYTRWSDIEKAFRTKRLKGSYYHATAESHEIIEIKKQLSIQVESPRGV